MNWWVLNQSGVNASKVETLCDVELIDLGIVIQKEIDRRKL